MMSRFTDIEQIVNSELKQCLAADRADQITDRIIDRIIKKYPCARIYIPEESKSKLKRNYDQVRNKRRDGTDISSIAISINRSTRHIYRILSPKK